MNELESYLILNAISGVGSVRLERLLSAFGSADNILKSGLNELLSSGAVPHNVAREIVLFNQEKFLKDEWAAIEKDSVYVITINDVHYPSQLKEIPGAPIVLYVKGSLEALEGPAIAMVGSRNASHYGLSIAERFSRRLSACGITIVSGLARGIDTASHRGALKVGGKTIAVLGCGLSHIYPPDNKELFRMISRSGCLISEFPMATPPATFNFPRRNRIISGLSLGVVVVEASPKSGALITSRFALEQGRDVFAVPGAVDSPHSLGTHQLIKQGAKLVGSVEDILEELTLELKGTFKTFHQDAGVLHPGKNRISHLTSVEKDIFDSIGREGSHIDAILTGVEIPAPQALEVLLKLELKHLIKQMPGKVFVKTANE